MSTQPPDDGFPWIGRLEATHAGEVTRLLCEAFFDYPVMRFVLGETPDYAGRLVRLIGLFTAGRWLRGHPVLGLRGADGSLQAAITMTPRGAFDTPPALAELAETTWNMLGAETKQRYAMLCEAWAATEPAGENWHVNMLGVAKAAHGAGHGGRLLAAALDLAAKDPVAQAVDLTTEDAANLSFYTRRGFEVTGQRRVGPTLETWTLVAPRRADGGFGPGGA
ncbi:GNAT family N-acetyltransferase [Arenimonas daejeonensis]|uniref:GNAT family N-acetyltransferase n=1 Tax=Arenimonas daejeonensis TaxID=370777 RepID=UPI0011BF2B64|nr:GNAT family N-acetyltransferase [Arenimonas daejeonensis]